jgi:lysozyme
MQYEFDTLISWSFNTGGPAMKKLNAGNKAAIPAELVKWNRVGGRVLFGLSRRRKAEDLMFAGDGKGALALAHSWD